MNEKEKNLAIYNAIAEVASGVFTEIEGKYGTFSAREVCHELNHCKLHFKKGFDENKEKTVSVDTFSSNFKAGDVFRVLCKCESLVQKSDRVTFTKEMNEGKKILEFKVPKNMPKLLNNLAEEWKGVISNVCLDMNLQAIVATDSYTLNALNVDVTTYEKTNETYIIHPDAFKKSDKVVITKKGDVLYANGVEIQYPFFPKWKALVPEVSTNQSVVFKKWSDFTKALKNVNKITFEENVQLVGNIGCNFIKIVSDNVEKNIELFEPLKQEINITINVEHTLAMLPSKVLYIKNGSHVILGTNQNSLTFCLPVIGEMPDQTDKNNTVNVFEDFATKIEKEHATKVA